MITLQELGTLLPQAKNPNEETWELRFLFQHKTESIPQDILFAEYSQDTGVMRFTFPAVSRLGRARIWLKRSLAPLTAGDVMNYFQMVNTVSQKAKLKVVLSEAAEGLLKRFGGDLERYTLPPERKTRAPRQQAE